MYRQTCRRLTLALAFLMSLSGCDTDRQLPQSSVSNSGHIMELWNIYTHCHRSDDLDAMHADAQQLSRAVDSVDDPTSPERHEPTPMEPTTRLSVDPAEMAASCALHVGQSAQEMGRLHVAREMFYMVVIRFPQPRYQYYKDQALLGLERLDTASCGTLHPPTSCGDHHSSAGPIRFPGFA
jgi:hypothetical protein